MDFNGTGYNIILVLHILAAVSAFGPLFLYSSLQQAGDTGQALRLHMRQAFPSLVVLGILGMALVGLSDENYGFDQAWIVVAAILWLVLIAVSWFVIRPALKDTGEGAQGRLGAGVGITHLGLVVALYLMVFRPGL